MSEGKEGAHGKKEEANLGGIRYSGEGGRLPASKRRGKVGGPRMTGEGLFDSPEAPVVVRVAEPTAEIKTPLEPRSLKFKAGTKIYRIVRDGEGKIQVPRTPDQASGRLEKVLTVPTIFDVPVEYLERGKRGGTITKKVGQSDYGAFTVIRFPVRLRSGEFVMEDRLASYTTRSSKKNY